MDYETIKIEIDEEVKHQAEQILGTNHLTMERAMNALGVQEPERSEYYKTLAKFHS